MPRLVTSGDDFVRDFCVEHVVNDLKGDFFCYDHVKRC